MAHPKMLSFAVFYPRKLLRLINSSHFIQTALGVFGMTALPLQKLY